MERNLAAVCSRSNIRTKVMERVAGRVTMATRKAIRLGKGLTHTEAIRKGTLQKEALLVEILRKPRCVSSLTRTAFAQMRVLAGLRMGSMSCKAHPPVGHHRRQLRNIEMEE